MSALTPAFDGLPGIDLLAEYRSLQDWSAALDDQLAGLNGITAQLQGWEAATPDDDLLMIQLNQIMAGAAVAEADRVAESYDVVDVGFQIVFDLAEAYGIDPDDLDWA